VVPVILGLLALALVLWLAKSYIKVDPGLLKRYGRKIGGYASFAAAALLVFKGRIDAALLLGGLGGWLLGVKIPILPWYQPNASQQSLRTVWLDLTSASDGAFDGHVIGGPFAGRTLNTLERDDLFRLLNALSDADPAGYNLFQTYLDRRLPGWRETAEGHAHTRQRRTAATTAMTEQEAYEVLGIEMGASEEQIREAHRALLRKLHPDQGGTTWLATRINMARDVLLNRHR
jgi:hypothetical protein